MPRLLAPAVTLLCLTGLTACQKQADIAHEPPRPVKIVVVPAPSENRDIVLSGSVKARVESNLSFRVSGKIIERKVDIGQRVMPGDILARIDLVDLKLGLKNTDAMVDSAKARLRVAEDELARNEALFSRGYVAQSALDRASLEVDQAKAGLTQALAARDQSLNQTNYAELAADTAGVITGITADIGQVVSAGSPVITLSREDEKEVAVFVPEQDIRYFQKGMIVDVAFWADPTLITHGTIREIAGAADSSSRTFAVRVALGNEQRILLGQTASITAHVPVTKSAPVIPVTAIAKQGDQPIVWVVNPDTKTVKSKSVELGQPADDGLRIEKGLMPHDIIVTAGTQFLTEGQEVKLPSSALASATP
jgi:RND family efflux transporter MFP subunit